MIARFHLFFPLANFFLGSYYVPGTVLEDRIDKITFCPWELGSGGGDHGEVEKCVQRSGAQPLSVHVGVGE